MRYTHLHNLAFDVRCAQPNDVQHLAEILAVSFYGDRRGQFSALNQWLYPLIRWGIAIDLKNRLADSNSRYVCLSATQAHRTEVAIATLEISMRNIPQRGSSLPCFSWQNFQYPYISNLAVHPQWRRQGAAIDLLKAAEQRALHWGFKYLFLHVLENNEPAQQLYQRLGYQLYKVDPDISFWLLGSPRRLLLRKLL